MKKHQFPGLIIAGGCAGLINGLIGTGGGMVLIPLLGFLTDLDDSRIFSTSVAIILPITLVSLCASAITQALPFITSLPYLIGSAIGGYFAAKFGDSIPTRWLHRVLGILILFGGVRYLC